MDFSSLKAELEKNKKLLLTDAKTLQRSKYIKQGDLEKQRHEMYLQEQEELEKQRKLKTEEKLKQVKAVFKFCKYPLLSRLKKDT